jgi:hypothetical protein
MKWLTSEDPAYLAALAAQPQADVYHQPAYLRSVAGDGAVRILVGAGVVLPLIVKSVPAFLEAAGSSDAESPYGYAAPLFTSAVDWSAVAEAMRAAGIVNAFLRNHPLQDWGEHFSVSGVTRAPTVVVPLNEGREQAFAGARCATQRSQVARARKLGFRVELVTAPADLSGFRALYELTMARLQAAESYLFPDAAWRELIALGEQLALVTVRDADGTIHNQALFLRGSRFVHYHLSARSDTAHNAAGNLLFEAAADWAVSLGCTAIHLGGGTSGREDDGLLAYKRRIGRGDATFRTAGLIADPVAHATLVDRWRARSGVAPRWFQAYRQPL